MEKYFHSNKNYNFPKFPLKFKLIKMGSPDKTIADGMVDPQITVKFAFTRAVFYERLEPGVYRVIVETTSNYPELKDYDTRIIVNYDFAK